MLPNVVPPQDLQGHIFQYAAFSIFCSLMAGLTWCSASQQNLQNHSEWYAEAMCPLPLCVYSVCQCISTAEAIVFHICKKTDISREYATPAAYSRLVAVQMLQVTNAADIVVAERLLFPGVGAFEQCMGTLKRCGYVEPLKDYIQVCFMLELHIPCVLEHARIDLLRCSASALHAYA